jgi:hypothetical protein
LSEYKVPSPAAIAARQLEQAGKSLRPGQIVRFIYTLGEPGVRAWDLVGFFNQKTIDTSPYKALLNRAMETVVKSFGIQKEKQLPIPMSSPGFIPVHKRQHDYFCQERTQEFITLQEAPAIEFVHS